MNSAKPPPSPPAPDRRPCSEPLFALPFNPRRDVERFRAIEWLLPDGVGGFSMGTALGLNTRRYHGAMIAATNPPVGRVAALNAIVERISIGGMANGGEKATDLATFEFVSGHIAPRGFESLARFEKGIDFVRWVYRAGDHTITREWRRRWRCGGFIARYSIDGPPAPIRLSLAPLMRLDDTHHLGRRRDDRFEIRPSEGSVTVHRRDSDLALNLASGRGVFRAEPDWWYDFHYEEERRRGMDHVEDLLTPGWFEFAFESGKEEDERAAILVATINDDDDGEIDHLIDVGSGAKSPFTTGRLEHINSLRQRAGRLAPSIAERTALLVAADDFIVPRRVGDQALSTILAGYPWFTDWGRDTMISLPGLLLVPGRSDEALRVLRAFAGHRRNGLIPNLFDDQAGAAHYNTVDASLWFVHACAEYVRFSGDRPGFHAHLLDACLDVLRSYEQGTDFDIRMDPVDGLITAGGPQTQLTWMDAARDGVVFTPRFGKCIEINALWFHDLLAVAELLPDDASGHEAHRLRELAERAGRSIGERFWSDSIGCLADVLVPERRGAEWRWIRDETIRPNQIFAASLRHSALTAAQRRAVVDVCRRELLTPMGLRTLSPRDSRYRARFDGDMFSRDGAYHQGTVWPWLMGPYIEALLRSESFSAEAKREAARLVERLLQEMAPPHSPCLGQLAEVYDGEHDDPNCPQRAGGCPAQAWSIAELVRSLSLIA